MYHGILDSSNPLHLLFEAFAFVLKVEGCRYSQSRTGRPRFLHGDGFLAPKRTFWPTARFYWFQLNRRLLLHFIEHVDHASGNDFASFPLVYQISHVYYLRRSACHIINRFITWLLLLCGFALLGTLWQRNFGFFDLSEDLVLLEVAQRLFVYNFKVLKYPCMKLHL